MGKPWTVVEEKWLASVYGRMPVPEICAKLGRTRSSIHQRASERGLVGAPRGARPRKHDYSEVREMIDFGYHPTHIAVRLGISTKAAYNLAARLGKPYHQKFKQNARARRRG